MKCVLAIILTAGAVFADTTNYLSQTWKELAWTRQPVMVSLDGELIDPSGTIAEAAFFSASQSYMQVMREALVDMPGAWLSWAGDNITTNGYRGCKRCSFERPTFARNSFVRGYPHLKFGLPGVGFDIGNGIFKVGSSVGVTTTNCFFTATGDTNLVFTLDNGFFKTTGGTSNEDSDDD